MRAALGARQASLSYWCLRRGADAWPAPGAGEHEHTIVGYSLIKGIGDGEPIASERFTVGGHEWVSEPGGP